MPEGQGPPGVPQGQGPLVSSHGQRCRHNLAHDSSHDPAHDPAHDSSHDPARDTAYDLARDPARNPAKGGWAVWRWPCGGHMTCHVTCHVTWQDNPLRVTREYQWKYRNYYRPNITIIYLFSRGI